MSFLKKPSNPIDAARAEQITNIAKRVMEVFSKQYLIAFKDVMIEDAIAKQDAKGAAKEPPPEPKEPKPRRQRGKITPQQHDTVNIKISTTEEIDSDIDPYIVYVVKSEFGDESATVHKRYKQFREINKRFGKKAKDVEFPGPSSKIGKRNLDYEFIKKRRKTLKKYLRALAKDKEVVANKEFLNWLGLGREEDPIFKETFLRALKKTKWHLWIWKKIIADEEADAIAKLIVEEIRRDMFYQIYADLPNDPKLRKFCMQLAYKSITAIVNPIVIAGWKAVQEAVAGIKEKVKQIVGEALGKILEVKAEIKTQIKGFMTAGFEPITAALQPLLGKLVGSFIDPLAGVMVPVLEERKRWDADFQVFLRKPEYDQAAYEAFGKQVMGVRDDLKKKVDDKIQEVVGHVLGPLKSEVSIDALAGIFTPIERLNSIFEAFFQLINPGNHEDIMRVMMRHKEEILKQGHNDPAKIEELLDREEQEVIWRRWWSCYYIRCSGWTIYYQLWRLLPDFGSVVELSYDLIWDLDRINRRAIKKMSWKFGDYLSDAVQHNKVEGDFKDTVDQCLIIGYERAMKYVKKELGLLGRKYLKSFFNVSIIGEITKMILPLIKEATDPLQDAIPPPVNELLDIQAMIRECIVEVLDEQIDKCVNPLITQIYVAFGGSPE